MSVVGLSILCRLNANAQTRQDSVNRNTAYNAASVPAQNYSTRTLHVDEVNLVSSYYMQNGNHSAVTGGIGTEHVTDVANGIDLNIVWTNHNNNKNTLAVGLGFDVHTAASQAYVSKTGASSPNGTRLYPSLDWTVESAKTGSTFGIGAYYSGEYNYNSLGADVHFSLKTNSKTGEFSAKLQGYFDHVKLIYPSEFIPQSTVTTTTVTTASGNSITGSGGNYKANIPSSPRETYSAAFSYTQILNSRLQIAILGDVVAQNGYLGLPFHRVYFSNGKDTIENLPSSRFKLPLGSG